MTGTPTGDSICEKSASEWLRNRAREEPHPQLQQAYEKYKAAFVLKQSFDIAGNLGAVELELGKLPAAAEHLEFSLRGYPANNPKGRATTAARLERAKKQVAIVVLKVNVTTATLAIDGQPFARRRAFLTPGRHTVTAEAEGYQPLARDLDLHAGTEQPIQLTLERTPPNDTQLPRDNSKSAPPLWPVAIGGVVTAVALGLGIAFRVIGDGQENDGDALRDDLAASGGGDCDTGPQCGELAETYADARTSHDLSTGLFIGAGGAAAITLVYTIISLTSTSDDSSRTASSEGAAPSGQRRAM